MSFFEVKSPNFEASEEYNKLIKNTQNWKIISKEDKKFSPNDNWLDSESPFQWQASRFEEVNSKEVIDQATHKAEFEYNSFDKFSRILTLVYEHFNNANIDDTKEALVSLESLLEEEESANFPELKLAMIHVFYASKAYFLSVLGHHELALEARKRIVPMNELPTDAQAAVHALKAKFFSLYRKKGFQQAVESARKAMELNSDEPKWMFLLAESLRREKKYFPSDELPKEELALLEEAIKKDRNPQYLVHLALRCITCVQQSWASHKYEIGFTTSKLFEVIQKMEVEAVNLIMEALQLEPDDEVINRRCAFGLMKARKHVKQKHKELIKRTLEKALALAPDSSMTLHFLGKYYMELGRDKKKALEYLQKSVQSLDNNYPAYCDLIRLQFEMFKSKYDPSEDLQRMLERQTELDPHYKHETLILLITYHLFVKKDLLKSIEYVEKIIDENGDPSMFNTRPIFLHTPDNVDLIHMFLYKLDTTTENIPNKEELIKKVRSFYSDPVVDYLKVKYTIEEIDKKLIKEKQLCSKTPENWRGSSRPWSRSLNNSLKPENHTQQSYSNWRVKNDSETSSERSWREEKPKEDIFSNWRKKNEESTEKTTPRSNFSQTRLNNRWDSRAEGARLTKQSNNEDTSEKFSWRGGNNRQQ